jgi:hypothetical protein
MWQAEEEGLKVRNLLGVPQPLYEKVMMYKESPSALADLQQRVACIRQVHTCLDGLSIAA